MNDCFLEDNFKIIMLEIPQVPAIHGPQRVYILLNPTVVLSESVPSE